MSESRKNTMTEKVAASYATRIQEQIKKRKCRIASLDYEYYSGPIEFIWDTAWFAVIYVMVYAIYVYYPAPRPLLIYAAVAGVMFTLINVKSAMHYTFEAYIVSDVLNLKNSHFPDIADIAQFFAMALTGVRFKRGFKGLMDALLNVSLYSIWISLFFATGLYFVFELVFFNTYAVWMHTTTTYPSSVKDVGCEIDTIISTVADVFFQVTNNAAVIDILLALDGLYFNVLGYRADLRFFLTAVYPYMQEACNGANILISFGTDSVAQAAAVVFGGMVALVPFAAMYKSAWYIANSMLVWGVVFVAVTACGLSLYILNDIGATFFAFVIPGSSASKSVTSDGLYGFGSLITLGICSLMLTIHGRFAERKLIALTFLQRADEQGEDWSVDNIFHKISMRFVHLWQILWRIATSETLIFTLLTCVVAFYCGTVGLPICGVGFIKTRTGNPWPTYADYNDLEQALYNSSSSCTLDVFGIGTSQVDNFLECTIFKVVDKLSLINTQLAVQLINLVPTYKVVNAVCDAANAVGHLDCNIDLGTLIGKGTQALSDIVETAVKTVIFAIFTVGSTLFSQIDSVEKYIANVLKPLQNLLFNLFSFLDGIENFIEAIPNVTAYIPLLIVVLAIFATVLGVVFPILGTLTHMSLVVFFLQVVVGGTFTVQTLRLFLQKFFYDLKFCWNPYSVGVFLITLTMTLVSCFMLMSFEVDVLALDPVTIDLLDKFEQDKRHLSGGGVPETQGLIHMRRKTRRRKHNAVIMLRASKHI